MENNPSHPAPCPHCGEEIASGLSICPNCGTPLGSVWPPPPKDMKPLPPPVPKTLTGRVWSDFLAGAAVLYLTHLATARVLLRFVPTSDNSPNADWFAQAGAPGGFVLCEMFWAVVFGLLLYYGLRGVYKFVARGSGYATLALLAILLGAFFTCRPLVY